MEEVPLCPQCNPGQTLEAAHALHLQFAPPQPWRSVIVWRDRPKHVRPVQPKRLRDLRPGDEVIFRGQRETIYSVEVYR